MLCSSSNSHRATVFYPQTLKIRCFQPRLSVTPPQQQLQHTHPQELRISHNDVKPKLITSASNPFVKHCLKLRNNSSYRRSHGSVLVVGSTPIRSPPLFSAYILVLFYWVFFFFKFWWVEVVWE